MTDSTMNSFQFYSRFRPDRDNSRRSSLNSCQFEPPLEIQGNNLIGGISLTLATSAFGAFGGIGDVDDYGSMVVNSIYVHRSDSEDEPVIRFSGKMKSLRQVKGAATVLFQNMFLVSVYMIMWRRMKTEEDIEEKDKLILMILLFFSVS